MHSIWTASITGLLMLALAGCGGSSGDSVTTVGGNTGQGSLQQPKKLTLDAKQISNSCRGRREPLAGVTVLIHKDDGKILQTHQTAADGKLSVDWPVDAKHVTILYRDSEGRYTLDSFYDLSYTDLGEFNYIEPAVTSRCGCRKLTLDWQDIKKTMPEYRLQQSSDRQPAPLVSVDSGTPINICPTVDNQFGKLQLLLIAGAQSPSYFSEVDLDALAGQSNVQLKMSDFRQAGRLVNVSTGNGAGYLFQSSLVYGNYGSMLRQPQSRFNSGDPVRVFDLPGLKAAVSVQRSYSDANIDYAATHTTVVPESSKSVTITPPANLSVIAQKLQTLLNSNKNATSVDYDFSGIGPYQQMTITIDNNNFSWSYSAPLKGKIVDLQLPEAVSKVYESTNFSQVDFFLDGINGANDTRSFQQLMTEQSRDRSLWLKNPAFEHRTWEWLTIEQ